MLVVIDPEGCVHARLSEPADVAPGYRLLPEVVPSHPADHRLVKPAEPIPSAAVVYAWTAEPISSEELAARDLTERRARRDAAMRPVLDLLSRHRNQADYGLPTTLSAEQATAWAIYAQALRDYPETGSWPVEPAEVA